MPQYARERYQSFAEENKKKCQCYCDYQKSLPEDRKQTIAEIKRNSYITHKIKGQAS